MTHQFEVSSAGGESNLAPGVAPSFGDVPSAPFEHLPERLVLSLTEHDQLNADRLPASWAADFSGEAFGSGSLLVEEADPGTVRVSADVLGARGPAIRLDATVRKTWLTRAVESGGGAPGTLVVRELLELAQLPGQSTVRISVAAD
jgi:hypothetical protein